MYKCESNILLKDGEELVKCKSNRNCEIICKELNRLSELEELAKEKSCRYCVYRTKIDNKLRCLKKGYIFQYGDNYLQLATECDHYDDE